MQKKKKKIGKVPPPLPYVPTLSEFVLIGFDLSPSCLTLPFDKNVQTADGGQTDGQTDIQTDGQSENIMPPAAGKRRHRNDFHMVTKFYH